MYTNVDVIDSFALVVSNETQALPVWVASPDGNEQWAAWNDCILRWLNALEARSKRTETSRAYRRDVSDFFLTYKDRDLKPWQVTKIHVMHWVEWMRTRGLSDATINRRLAALSSLYRFAAEEYTVLTIDGETGLWNHPNPFAGRSLRAKVKPYGRSVYLGADEVRAVLRSIDLTTVTGWRNMALLYGMFATTRRVNEWVGLKWGDIHDGPEGKWFSYRYKGGETKRQAIPPDLWRVITIYLEKAGRSDLQPGDYLFTALGDAARRFSNTPDDYDPTARAITASYVNKLLHRYGLPHGISKDRLHAHALRHAGARFRKSKGATPWQLRDILGHANIAITMIYSDEVLEDPVDDFGGVVGEVLPDQLRMQFPASAAPQSAPAPHNTDYHNTGSRSMFGSR